MPSPREKSAQAMRTSPGAAVGAVKSWTKSAQSAFGALSGAGGSFDPDQVIDQVFDFAEKMLQVQREFTKTLVTTAAAAGKGARPQATSAGDAVREQSVSARGAVRDQVESAREAVREQAKDYKGLTKAELQGELASRDLPKTGNVDALRQRLIDDDQN